MESDRAVSAEGLEDRATKKSSVSKETNRPTTVELSVALRQIRSCSSLPKCTYLSKVGYAAMQISKHHQIRGMRHGPLMAGYGQSRPPKHA
jgi:hypothetical protein